MKLIKAIKAFFIHYWRKLTGQITETDLDDVSDLLSRAIIEKRGIERQLIMEVNHFLDKNYGYKKSKFRLFKRFNKAQLYTAVMAKYSNRIEQSSLTFTKKLSWDARN